MPVSAHCRSSKTNTDGPLIGDPLEERPPGAEELLALIPIGFLDAEQSAERRLQPAPLVRIRHELVERGAQLLARLVGTLTLRDARPASNHLAQCPDR